MGEMRITKREDGTEKEVTEATEIEDIEEIEGKEETEEIDSKTMTETATNKTGTNNPTTPLTFVKDNANKTNPSNTNHNSTTFHSRNKIQPSISQLNLMPITADATTLLREIRRSRKNQNRLMLTFRLFGKREILIICCKG